MISERIEFLVGTPASCPSRWAPLYYSQPYLDQLETDVLSFFAIKKSNQEALMVIHFQIVGDQAISLRDAPFGGLHLKNDVEKTIIDQFLKFILDAFEPYRLNQLIIKTAPPFCQNNKLDLHYYNKFGFTIAYTDINHHIEISQPGIAGHLSAMQKRRLEKCKKANFRFKKEKNSELEAVYNFIASCRREKAQSLSVSLDELDRLLQTAPDSYSIFCCYDKKQLIAATVCAVVNEGMLYHFLPASDPAYNTYSPMVYLISQIYEYCLKTGIEILDLGTSMLDKEPNDKLIAFKKRMGGIATERPVYSLKL